MQREKMEGSSEADLFVKVASNCSRNGVYFMRMLSPIGVNSQLCCDYYGLPLLNIHAVAYVKKILRGLCFASQFYWN